MYKPTYNPFATRPYTDHYHRLNTLAGPEDIPMIGLFAGPTTHHRMRIALQLTTEEILFQAHGDELMIPISEVANTIPVLMDRIDHPGLYLLDMTDEDIDRTRRDLRIVLRNLDKDLRDLCIVADDLTEGRPATPEEIRRWTGGYYPGDPVKKCPVCGRFFLPPLADPQTEICESCTENERGSP